MKLKKAQEENSSTFLITMMSKVIAMIKIKPKPNEQNHLKAHTCLYRRKSSTKMRNTPIAWWKHFKSFIHDIQPNIERTSTTPNAKCQSKHWKEQLPTTSHQNTMCKTYKVSGPWTVHHSYRIWSNCKQILAQFVRKEGLYSSSAYLRV